MIVLFLVCMISLGLSTIPALFAVENQDAQGTWKGRCKLEGTWITGGASWKTITTYVRTGANDGIETVALVDPPVAWLFPNSYSTQAGGVWKQIGLREYEYIMQGYVVERVETETGPANVIRFIGITKGVKTLTSCNTMEATVQTDYFFPGEDMPFWSDPVSTTTGQRLTVGQDIPLPE